MANSSTGGATGRRYPIYTPARTLTGQIPISSNSLANVDFVNEGISIGTNYLYHNGATWYKLYSNSTPAIADFCGFDGIAIYADGYQVRGLYGNAPYVCPLAYRPMTATGGRMIAVRNGDDISVYLTLYPSSSTYTTDTHLSDRPKYSPVVSEVQDQLDVRKNTRLFYVPQKTSDNKTNSFQKPSAPYKIITYTPSGSTSAPSVAVVYKIYEYNLRSNQDNTYFEFDLQGWDDYDITTTFNSIGTANGAYNTSSGYHLTSSAYNTWKNLARKTTAISNTDDLGKFTFNGASHLITNNDTITFDGITPTYGGKLSNTAANFTFNWSSTVSLNSSYSIELFATPVAGNGSTRTQLVAATSLSGKSGSISFKVPAAIESYLDNATGLNGNIRIGWRFIRPNDWEMIDYPTTSTTQTVVNTTTIDFFQKIAVNVSEVNLPTIDNANSLARKYQSHNADSLVLANGTDKFSYSIMTYSNNPLDSRRVLHILYGDTVAYQSPAVTTNNITYTHGPFTIAPYTQGQKFDITMYVSDARGRKSATVSIVSGTGWTSAKGIRMYKGDTSTLLTVAQFVSYNYQKPQLTLTAFRCKADGTPSDTEGTNIKVSATWVIADLPYSTISGLSTPSASIYTEPLNLGPVNWTPAANGNKTQILANALITRSYDVYFKVTDAAGVTSIFNPIFIPSGEVFMDFRAGGNGLSVGKRSEVEDTFEVSWDAIFYGDVNVRGNINLQGNVQNATTATAVTYNDTEGIGANTVQAAITALAKKAGLSKTEAQVMIDAAVNKLNIPTDNHINSLIAQQITNLDIPEGVTQLQVQNLINTALTNYVTTTAFNEAIAGLNTKIDSKANAADLNHLIKKSEVIAGYYNKEDIDNKLANLPTDVDLSGYYTKAEIDDKLFAIPSNQTAVEMATEALEKAETAKTASDTATVKSNLALEKAENAEDTADDAKTIAEGIDGKATTAMTDAAAAVTTANGAKTTADQAKAIAEDAKSTIDNFIADNTSTAAEVTFEDTVSLGASTVQSAIVALAGKPHLTQAQVNNLIAQALADYYTKSQIDTKFNNYYTKSQTNTQISTATAAFRTEAQIQQMIDTKFNSIVNGNNVAY